MLDQNIINDVFTQRYSIENTAQFENGELFPTRERIMTKMPYSGYALLSKIGVDEKILDIGCGRNLFKSQRPNLIGIDPVTIEADLQIAFQDYRTTEKFDVILCLGSVQFGVIQDIKSQIARMTWLIKQGGRIYWRCNTRTDFFWEFPWTKELHQTLATEFGYTLADIQDEYAHPDYPETYRIYAEWVKN